MEYPIDRRSLTTLPASHSLSLGFSLSLLKRLPRAIIDDFVLRYKNP